MSKINAKTVQEAVYEELLKSILSGKIRPGDKLTIEEIADSMDVSTTPVRVALKKLEAGNFIKIGKNRRISVSEISIENLKEIFEIRLMLELYAVEHACDLRDDSSIQILKEIDNKCNQSLTGEEYLKHNYDFHMFLYKQAKMPILMNHIESLWNQVSPYLHILLEEELNSVKHNFSENHNNIINALENRDKEKIKKWLKIELTNSDTITENKMKRL